MGLTRSVHMLQVEETAGLLEAAGWACPAGSSESPPGPQGVPRYAAAPSPARAAGSRRSQLGSQDQLPAHADSGTAHPAGSGGSQPKTCGRLSAGYSAGVKIAWDIAASLFHAPRAVDSADVGEQAPSPSRVADLSKSSLQRAERGEEALVQECKAVRHGLLHHAPPGLFTLQRMLGWCSTSSKRSILACSGAP